MALDTELLEALREAEYPVDEVELHASFRRARGSGGGHGGPGAISGLIHVLIVRLSDEAEDRASEELALVIIGFIMAWLPQRRKRRAALKAAPTEKITIKIIGPDGKTTLSEIEVDA